MPVYPGALPISPFFCRILAQVRENGYRSMIRLFDGKLVVASKFEGFAGRFGLNLAVATASAILGFLYFGADFAAGDSPEPISAGVIVFLSSIVAAIVGLVFWGGWRWARFPWPALVLTPLLLAAIFSLFGDGAAGMNMGMMAGAVLLLGALIGRALRQEVLGQKRPPVVSGNPVFRPELPTSH